MEHWQFLIQQQGDRIWRPLESPTLEIESGIYRVVARFNRANTDVEVRVTHSSKEESPPKRRVYSRSRRTNSEGLMAVIPFTHLNPGIWELRCSGDLMSDMLGKSWQYTIYLQVLPHKQQEQFVSSKTEALSIKSPSHSPTHKLPHSPQPQRGSLAPTHKLTNSPTSFDEPASPVWLKAETAEQILKNLVEIALPSAQTPLTDETTVDDTQVALPDLPLLLTLDQQTYIAHWGETLTVNGHVELKQTSLNISDKLEIGEGELQIELRSPQTSQIITQTRQAIGEKSLPFKIKCSLEIPSECESKLILADISLYSKVAFSNDVILLASQSFTITASVTQLLAISLAKTTHEPSAVDNLPQLDAAVSPSVPLDLELFNLVKTAKTYPSLLMKRSPKKSLPPQLISRTDRQLATSPPELPTLPGQKTQTLFAASVVAQLKKLGNLDKNNVINTSKLLPIEANLPYLKRIKALASDIQKVQSDVSLSTPVIQNPEELEHKDINEADEETSAEIVVYNPQFQNKSDLVAPSDQIIDTTNPQISPLLRKWVHSQGYSLSQPITLLYQDDDEEDKNIILYGDDKNKTYTLNTEEKEDQQEYSLTHKLPHSQTPPLLHSQTPPLPHSPHSPTPPRSGQEVVLDDTCIETEALKKGTSDNTLTASKSEISSQLIVLRNTEPLPVPQLHLHDGELISGNSVRLIVKITEQCPQVAVKLWVEDCQTRWLLDGPRLLRLLPNSFGGWEVMSQINVPFGCLKIRIEAIAVDMATQQESHKVTVVRNVVPPNLPTLQLNELLGI
ncbi:hypothetical protein [Iningainema tapete]|uniref:Uncharacterized protein n=1 Tax=Iningainema tapete BLCC-T55 TaxID=2748662 RepID=A0A8J7C0V5_9CYAN|nr:hypothetical protein [Iningainema tapete]MBD2778743.1 hypothetical protein [Iningainema tapete BLCC-T55]